MERRVLIAAPGGRDLEVLGLILEQAGIGTARCRTVDELCGEMDLGAAAAIVAQEMLPAQARPALISALRRQAGWSDFPMIIMGGFGSADVGLRSLSDVQDWSNAVLLERPVRKITLLSTVRAAMQSRSRQYQVRDELLRRRRAERALRESAAQFRRMADTAPAMLWLTDADHHCTFVSRRWQEFTGQFEIAGRWPDWTAPIHADDREETRLRFLEAAAKRDGFRRDYRLRTASGNYRWVIAAGQPRFDEHGLFAGYIGSVIDVHERKNAEQALRDSEERFRSLVAATAQIVWTNDAQGRFMEDSPSWRAFTGQTFEQCREHGWLDALHPEDRERVSALWRNAVETRSFYEAEYRLRTREGEYRWTAARGVPIVGPAGNVRQWIGANTDIHERKRAEESAREEAHRKDVFLATLAHELRNPLAPIRSGIELLRMEAPDPARFQEICTVMERQTQQLIVLVDDLLDVSRITRGKLNLNKSRVSMREVLEIALGTAMPLFEQAGHQLTVDTPDEEIVIDADPHRMAQVLSNLLSNAAKYTPPGGRIRLTVEAQGPELLVSVRDSGVGIPAEMREAIFDMFTQVEQPLEETLRGLGIGLTLVRSLVEMHGGSIEARSDGIGRGSEFLIRAPIVVSEPKGRPDVARKDEPTAQPKRRVLVVDDNEAAADMLALLLERFGNEVRTANDGEKAVEVAAELRPDLVLMDLGMPKVDGLEAARRIRSQPWGESMFLAALTGFGQEADKQRTKEAGFDFHLVKPINTDDLRRLLSEVGRHDVD